MYRAEKDPNINSNSRIGLIINRKCAVSMFSWMPCAYRYSITTLRRIFFSPGASTSSTGQRSKWDFTNLIVPEITVFCVQSLLQRQGLCYTKTNPKLQRRILHTEVSTMSYCSDNRLPSNTSINRLLEVIELLGYQKASLPFKIENRIGSYMWLGNDNAISFVGLELDIYREKDCISVQTRTRVGRSYWELQWQNKTISILKALFGGSFSTDQGVNQYMRNEEPEPSKVSSSLYMARWIFNNAVMKPKVFLDSIQMTGDIAREERTEFPWLDSFNPRILSGNMIIPYLIGCWESYFRNSYVAILKFSEGVSENALRRCNLSSKELLMVVKHEVALEDLIADSLSFQRPSIIAENFRQINSRIDLAAWLRKPYHRRKKTLFDSITEIVSIRDSLVHTGNVDLSIMDKQIQSIINDLTAAVDRVYQGFGDVFGFIPNYSF